MSKVDLREKRSECMELLTQVDAASQIGEQRAQMGREICSSLDILSKILHTTSGRDTTVDKLTEVIADIQMGKKSDASLNLDSGAPDWTIPEADGAGKSRLHRAESELAEVTKAMAELKQWSKEAKENFKEEYNNQMQTLRRQLASLETELATLNGEAPASDQSDVGTQSQSPARRGAHGATVKLPQHPGAGPWEAVSITQGKSEMEHVSMSEVGTMDDSVAERRARKVQFDDSTRQPLQAATPGFENATGTVPVEWIERPGGRELVANRFLEIGVLNDTGIMIGDLLSEVDGQAVKGLGLDLVQPLLSGPTGSRVRLTLLRGDEPIRLMIERKSISALRTSSAGDSRPTTAGSEKSERSDTPMAPAAGRMEGGGGHQDGDQSTMASAIVVGKQRKGFVMMNPAAGSIRWTMHQSPRRLAEEDRKAKEAEELRLAAEERRQREAEDAARREEEEMQRRALEEARRRAALELQSKAEAEAKAKAKAEAEQRAREMAEAKAKLEAEEAAQKAAEEEEARRAQERRQQEEEAAARKLAEEERMQAEVLAVERARRERMERDRARLAQERIKADDLLAAGLKAARALDVAAAKKLLDEAVQITKVSHILDRKEQIQELRIDTEFAQIKLVEMKVEEDIARVRVILQREATPVDGRLFCKQDLAEAREAVAAARAACGDLYEPTFYIEHLEILAGEIDLAESRIVSATWMDALDKDDAGPQQQEWAAAQTASAASSPMVAARQDDGPLQDVEQGRPVQAAPCPENLDVQAAAASAAAEQAPLPEAKTPAAATPSPPASERDAEGAVGSESAEGFVADLVDGMVESAADISLVAFETDNSNQTTPDKKATDDVFTASEAPEEPSRAPSAQPAAAPEAGAEQTPELAVDEIQAEATIGDAEAEAAARPQVPFVDDGALAQETGDDDADKGGDAMITCVDADAIVGSETVSTDASVHRGPAGDAAAGAPARADQLETPSPDVPVLIDENLSQEEAGRDLEDKAAAAATHTPERTQDLGPSEGQMDAEFDQVCGGEQPRESADAEEEAADAADAARGSGSGLLPVSGEDAYENVDLNSGKGGGGEDGEGEKVREEAAEGGAGKREGEEAEKGEKSLHEDWPVPTQQDEKGEGPGEGQDGGGGGDKLFVAIDALPKDGIPGGSGPSDEIAQAGSEKGLGAQPAEGLYSEDPEEDAPASETEVSPCTDEVQEQSLGAQAPDKSSRAQARAQTAEQEAALDAAKEQMRKEIHEEEAARLKAEAERELQAAKAALREQVEQQAAEKEALISQMARDRQELEEQKAQLQALSRKLQEEAEQAVSAPSQALLELAKDKEALMQQMAAEVSTHARTHARTHTHTHTHTRART